MLSSAARHHVRRLHTSVVRRAEVIEARPQKVIVTPAVTPSPPPPPPPPAPTVVVRKASSTSKLGWFLAGAAISLTAGNYKLSQDIWSSAHAVEHVVASISPDLEQLEKAVTVRLDQLDKRVKQLESSQQQSASSKR